MFAQRVHAQRAARGTLRRARLRAGRLLRRAARPGVRRRRAQPRRLHRRAGARRRSASTSASACSRRRSSSALVIGRSATAARADDVVIGTVFAWVLGLGVLFLALFTSGASGGNGTAGVRVLFGSIFGLRRRDAWLAVAVVARRAAWSLAGDRPAAAVRQRSTRRSRAARGVPVRLLGVGFLVLLGAAAAEATQAVGALLLLGLLAAPGRRRAPAHRPALARRRPGGGDRGRLDVAGAPPLLRDRLAARRDRGDRGRHRRLPPRCPARPGPQRRPSPARSHFAAISAAKCERRRWGGGAGAWG